MIDKILWIQKAILKFTKEEDPIQSSEDCYPEPVSSASKSVSKYAKSHVARRESESPFHGGINFTLHRANGGYVVSTGYYDPNTDRHNENLHVVSDSEEIGDAISKIVTLEGLRNTH